MRVYIRKLIQKSELSLIMIGNNRCHKLLQVRVKLEYVNYYATKDYVEHLSQRYFYKLKIKIIDN